MSGLAPMTFSDESSVLAIPDVSAVNDPTVRRMFYFLMEENRKVHCALNHSIQASNAATAQLQSVSEALDVTREQLAVLNENLSGNHVLLSEPIEVPLPDVYKLILPVQSMRPR